MVLIVFICLQEPNITDSCVLSVSDLEFPTNDISVYPNPSNSFLNIKSNVNVAIEKVALVDVTGKEIFNQTNAQPIDVRKFSKGLYILQVKSQEGAVTSKKVLVN